MPVKGLISVKHLKNWPRKHNEQLVMFDMITNKRSPLAMDFVLFFSKGYATLPINELRNPIP